MPVRFRITDLRPGLIALAAAAAVNVLKLLAIVQVDQKSSCVETTPPAV
jgi:hypothetical protein